MPSPHHLLLAIDDTEESRKAVVYVGGIIGHAPHVHVLLLHVLPHIPPALLEHGGRDTPEEQEAASRELHEQIVRWRRRREEAAEALVADSREILETAGVAPERINSDFAAPLPEETIGHHILTAAIEHAADTVVVGRAPRSWLGGALHRSPSSALFRKSARGMAIWIVT